MSINTTHLLSFLLLFAFSNIVVPVENCVYTLGIRTGWVSGAGTDSNISIILYDELGKYIDIKNVERWGGLMGPNYDYFERGNLDFFSGRVPCLKAKVYAMNLTSDGTGLYPRWYVDNVEVTTTGVHGTCQQEEFTVDQWLAVDESPYLLTTRRNNCPSYRVNHCEHLNFASFSSTYI